VQLGPSNRSIEDMQNAYTLPLVYLPCMLLLPTQGKVFGRGAFNQIGKEPLFARASPSRAKNLSTVLGCEGRCLLLARYCSRQRFEQNCLCANRWRIRPKHPPHTSQRGFRFAIMEFVSLRIRRTPHAQRLLSDCVVGNSLIAKATAIFEVNLTC
jgi:hypothetical protein